MFGASIVWWVCQWEARSMNPPLQNKNRAAGWRCLWSGSPSLSQTWSGLQMSKQIQDVTREERQSYSRRPAGIRSAPCRCVKQDAQDNSRSLSNPHSRCADLHEPLSLPVRSPGLGSVHVFQRAVRYRTEPHRRREGRRRRGSAGALRRKVVGGICFWLLTLGFFDMNCNSPVVWMRAGGGSRGQWQKADLIRCSAWQGRPFR